MPTDAGIEPRTVATGALAVRRSIGPFSIFEESSEEPLKLPCITLRYEKMSTDGVTVEESSECSKICLYHSEYITAPLFPIDLQAFAEGL